MGCIPLNNLHISSQRQIVVGVTLFLPFHIIIIPFLVEVYTVLETNFEELFDTILPLFRLVRLRDRRERPINSSILFHIE